MIMLNVTKNQGINLSLEDTFQKTRAAEGQIDPLPSRFRVKKGKLRPSIISDTHTGKDTSK